MSDDASNLRADARINRRRILEVAREALTADPGAPMNAIARAAGVGPGTLYRHFPDRTALVLAVYRREIDELVALAPRLLAEHAPLAAFHYWCDGLAEFGHVKHGIAGLVEAADPPELERGYRPLLGALRQLMAACVASGDIRSGADAEDFLILLGLLWRVPPTTAGKARVKRILALAIRGLGVAA